MTFQQQRSVEPQQVAKPGTGRQGLTARDAHRAQAAAILHTACRVKGVGSRFRTTANHVENVSPKTTPDPVRAASRVEVDGRDAGWSHTVPG